MFRFIHRVLPRFRRFVKLREAVGAARVALKSSKAEPSTAKASETRSAARVASAAPVDPCSLVTDADTRSDNITPRAGAQT